MRDDERDARICDLRRQGRTHAQIAEQFGLNRRHVGRILERRGLSTGERGRPRKHAKKGIFEDDPAEPAS